MTEGTASNNTSDVGTTVSVCMIILLVIIVFGSILYVDSYLREINNEIKNMKNILITQAAYGPAENETPSAGGANTKQNTIDNIKELMKSFDQPPPRPHTDTKENPSAADARV